MISDKERLAVVRARVKGAAMAAGGLWLVALLLMVATPTKEPGAMGHVIFLHLVNGAAVAAIVVMVLRRL